MNSKITGVVEAIGTKFNGSVKVNGAWLNFGKGKNPGNMEIGRAYVLTLKDWEFNGKSGQNIDAIEPASGASVPEAKQPTKTAPPAKVDQSVWDKKDRSMMLGGIRHDAAELTNAALVTGTPVAKVLETYKELYDGILLLADGKDL